MHICIYRDTHMCVLIVRLFCSNFNLTSSAPIITAGLIKTTCCGFSRLLIYRKFALCKRVFTFAHNKI